MDDNSGENKVEGGEEERSVTFLSLTVRVSLSDFDTIGSESCLFL